MQRFFSLFSQNRAQWRLTYAVILGMFLVLSSTVICAQMAPMQLTNPAVDSVNGDEIAAWIADENMGVLYCELIAATGSNAKRVACFDSNGAVAPLDKTMSNR